MAAIWANKKKCSKFLFVDRIKIFADIDYLIYEETIENIKKCTNFAVSFPLRSLQKHDFHFFFFFFVQCIRKQLLDSVFVIYKIIKVSVKVISLILRLRLITLTSIFIILDNAKTSSSPCTACLISCTSLHIVGITIVPT